MKQIEAIAEQKKCTPAQAALAWVLAQGNDIVPIPGTKRRNYLEENIAAVSLTFTTEELQRIGDAIPAGSAAGTRYPERSMGSVNR